MNIIEDLSWRGAINQQTDAEGLAALTQEQAIRVYCGFDPTGDSLHIGHLIPFMLLRRFQLAGHTPVVLIGGGTGSIGDPSGRTSERSLQTAEQVKQNTQALMEQTRRIFPSNDSHLPEVVFVDNNEWLSEYSLLDFLRDVGKNFNINQMLAKDVVASRLETGISFTEFSYQILQSVDFHHLYKTHGIQLQIGGSDQWGNITSGLDFIRKKEGPEAKAYGLTIPLMLKADGTKFGKSAGGAVWLDPKKTTPYEFYQFWINQDDRDVIKYLKFFTFLSQEDIQALEESVANEPHKRLAQRTLAEEVTRFVHGEAGLESALRITESLFKGDIKALTADEIESGMKNMPHVVSEKGTFDLVPWLVDLAIEPSRRQAREDIKNGALSINGERITDVDAQISEQLAIEERFIVIRRGKKRYFLVSFA